MNIISITPNNLDQEHICCAIGNDKENTRRAQTFGLWFDGVFQFHELMTEAKFEQFLDSIQ